MYNTRFQIPWGESIFEAVFWKGDSIRDTAEIVSFGMEL